MDSVTEERRSDLARAVRDRRLELGLSLRAAGPAAGMKRVAWAELENGDHRLGQRFWAGLERALAWAPGSVAAILAGGEPTVATNAHARVAIGTGTANDAKTSLATDLEAEVERIKA